MKILAIRDVIRLKQVEHVISEKNILSQIRHPFVVNLSVVDNRHKRGLNRGEVTADVLLRSEWKVGASSLAST